MKPNLSVGAFSPLCFGAALAAAGAADARVTAPEGIRAIGPDPSATATAEAARAQGRAMLALNKPAEALQSYRQALLQDPDSAETLNGLAVTYDRLGRFEDSRTHYEMALGIDPASPTLLYNYGLSLFLQGKSQQAARFLTLAVASGDEQVQAASLRALARIEQQRSPIAMGQPAEPAEASGGDRIVRTNAHEVRLILDTPAGRRKVAPVQLASALSPEAAAATSAIAGFTPREEARIAAQEYAAIAAERAEAEALRAAELASALAAARVPVPEEMGRMQQAAASRNWNGSAVLPEDVSGAARVFATPGQLPDDIGLSHFLNVVPSGARTAGLDSRRQQAQLALIAAGLAVSRPAVRQSLASDTVGDSGLRKRAFASPFESDNSRLNDFAGRLHGHAEPQAPADVAAQLAMLDALIARVRNA